MNELVRRTISGAVYVILLLGALWFHQYSLLLLLYFILIVGLREFFALMEKTGRSGYLIPAFAASFPALALAFLVAAGSLTQEFLLLFPLFFLVIPLSVKIYRPVSLRRSYFSTLSGALYLTVPLSSVPFICYHFGQYDYRVMFGFFFLLWTYDSFAYLSGVTFGKNKMFPKISPKKTWEGFTGGLLASILLAAFLHPLLGVLSARHWIFISLILVVTGTVGDFAESWLKRRAGVKDSGNIMPGHGGILDRLDSVLFSIPFVYLYIEFLS